MTAALETILSGKAACPLCGAARVPGAASAISVAFACGATFTVSHDDIIAADACSRRSRLAAAEWTREARRCAGRAG